MSRRSAAILLVDDEPLVLDSLCRYVRLQRRGWRVLRADDGLEALRVVEREPVDVIVTDVRMPGKDGFGLIKSLCAHERHRNIPVIVLTGLADRDLHRRVLEGGAIDLLRKPVDVRELVRHVERALGEKRERDERAADHEAMVAMLERRDGAPRGRAGEDAGDRTRATILSSLSHELLTPLTAIRASAELLSLYEEAPREEFLDIILDESRRMTRLVGTLLELVALESGAPVRRSDVAIVDLARACRRRLIPRLRERGLALRIVADDDALRVVGNERQLERVLDELLSNAIRFTGDGGKLRVRIGERDGRVRVEVTDQGVGFTREESRDAAKAFWQRGDGLTDKPSGLGVGLALCRAVVSRHGSRLMLGRTEDGGRVSFDLERAEGFGADVDSPARSAAAPPEVAP